jgi:flagellar biosynthesis protein FliP
MLQKTIKRIIKIFTLASVAAVMLLFVTVTAVAAGNDTEPIIPNNQFTQNFNEANPNPMQNNISNDSETAVKQVNPNTDIAPAEESELYKLIGVDASKPIEVILLVTIISVAPSILLMMTCFTRIIIVFGFLRNAMQTQTTPPNQIMTGLALFLTVFIMWPTLMQVNEIAYKPYANGELTAPQAIAKASEPIKDFMLRQTSKKNMTFFLNLANKTIYENNNAVNSTETTPEVTTASTTANSFFQSSPVTIRAGAEPVQTTAVTAQTIDTAVSAADGNGETSPLIQPAGTQENRVPADLMRDGITLENYRDQLGMEIVIPAFMISELSRAFQMGFMIFIPFLIIDIVVSSVLMSMGMMMLPPAMISLPFKIMMFVLVDGWRMLIGSIITSFN